MWKKNLIGMRKRPRSGYLGLRRRELRAFWKKGRQVMSTKAFLRQLHTKFWFFLHQTENFGAKYKDLNGRIIKFFYKKFNRLRFFNLDWFLRMNRFNGFGLKSAIVNYASADKLDYKRFYFPKKLYNKLERKWYLFFRKFISKFNNLRILRKNKSLYALLKRKWRLKWFFKKSFFRMSISSYNWGFDPNLRNYVVYFDTGLNKSIKILFSKFYKKIKILERKIPENLNLYNKSFNLRKFDNSFVKDYFSIRSRKLNYKADLTNYLLNFDQFLKLTTLNVRQESLSVLKRAEIVLVKDFNINRVVCFSNFSFKKARVCIWGVDKKGVRKRKLNNFFNTKFLNCRLIKKDRRFLNWRLNFNIENFFIRKFFFKLFFYKSELLYLFFANFNTNFFIYFDLILLTFLKKSKFEDGIKLVSLILNLEYLANLKKKFIINNKFDAVSLRSFFFSWDLFYGVSLDEKFYYFSSRIPVEFYKQKLRFVIYLKLKNFCKTYCKLLKFFFVKKFYFSDLKLKKKRNFVLLIRYFFRLQKILRIYLKRKNKQNKRNKYNLLRITFNEKPLLKRKLKLLNLLLKRTIPFTDACHIIIYCERRVHQVFSKMTSYEQMDLWKALDLYNFGLTFGEDKLIAYQKEEAEVFDESNWGGILDVRKGSLLKSEFTEIFDNN